MTFKTHRYLNSMSLTNLRDISEIQKLSYGCPQTCLRILPIYLKFSHFKFNI